MKVGLIPDIRNQERPLVRPSAQSIGQPKFAADAVSAFFISNVASFGQSPVSWALARMEVSNRLNLTAYPISKN